MKIRRTIGTALLAGGLFLALAGPALAGDMGPGQAPMGKDGAPMTAGVGPGAAPAGMAPSAGPAPGGMAPSSVMPAPARAGGLDPMTAGAALSGLGMLVLGGGLALRRRSV